MKIHVIFTGGTIGSCIKDGFISTDEATKYKLISYFSSQMADVEFTISKPYTLLSENLSAKELNILQSEVASALSCDYDGIIVTHGTDTLQYTGCALEYAFGSTHIPIVLVSAAFPLEDDRTNGYDNFKAAVEFIKSKLLGGVFVSYKNKNSKDVYIHLPSKILQHPERSDDIFSFSDEYVARFDGEKIEKLCLPKNPVSNGITSYCHDSGILVIDPRPGDSFRYLLDGIKAVILKPYHSATLDTGNNNLKSFCLMAKEKNVPVFVVDITDGASYDSTKVFDAMFITRLHGTYISNYMQLWAKISCNKLS